MERVDDGGVEFCNLELVNTKSQVVSEMPLGPEGRSSQPPKAKRVRISSGKRLANLKRAEDNSGSDNSGSICETSRVTMMPDPSNKPKLILDKDLAHSEMVESDDGSCFFVGEAVPEEEARQRWPHRYEKNHFFVQKVGVWLHCSTLCMAASSYTFTKI